MSQKYSIEKIDEVYDKVCPLMNRVGYVHTKEAAEMAGARGAEYQVVATVFNYLMSTMEEQGKAVKKRAGMWYIIKPNERIRSVVMCLMLALFMFACGKESTPRPALEYKLGLNVFRFNDSDKKEIRPTKQVTTDSVFTKTSINGTIDLILVVKNIPGAKLINSRAQLGLGSLIIANIIPAKSSVAVDSNTSTEWKCRYRLYFDNDQMMEGFIYVNK